MADMKAAAKKAWVTRRANKAASVKVEKKSGKKSSEQSKTKSDKKDS